MSVAILKKCSLFFELYDDEIQKVVKKCSVRTVEPGQDIIRQHEMGHEFYIILDGEVKITKTQTKADGTGDTKRILLGSLGAGDVFGELILLNDNMRTATVTASTQTDLLVINQDTIYSLYNFQSKIFSILLLNLARILSNKLKFTTGKLEDINKKFKQVKKMAS